jgi:drug/metabolite transporter (DMT)-like permease
VDRVTPPCHIAAKEGAMRHVIGPALIGLFAASQALRDVYFAGVFQSVNFFVVILLAFAISAVVFAGVTRLRHPGELSRIREDLPCVMWMNLTTAIAWICYFFSLKHLQPSIVNTLHSGVGPLTVIALAGLGIHIARPSPLRRMEHLCYAGLALSLAGLAWIVLSGQSGLPSRGGGTEALGLVLLVVSGASITISLLFSRRLNERGISPDGVTATRYILIIAVTIATLAFHRDAAAMPAVGDAAMLALATSLLIVLPLYALQAGIARTTPLTAHAVRSLGPILVFALELLDGRVGYSAPTLGCILAYSFFAIAINAVRGWHGTPATLSLQHR